MHYSENELWQQINKGDRLAFETLFHRFYAPLCGYAHKLLQDRDNAENVVQELFCQLWESRQNTQISSNVKAYLFKSVFNKALNQMKRDKRVQPLLSFESDMESEFVPELIEARKEAEHNDLQEHYKNALSAMPEGRRTIFQLSRNEGLSYKEIADSLQISIKTVENQMGKALSFLRIRLADFLVLLIALVPFFKTILTFLGYEKSI